MEKNKRLKQYILNNKIFLIFIAVNLFNSILLRALTISGVNAFCSLSPILGDLTIILLLGSFGYLMNDKKQIIYYNIVSIILMILCTINSSYYTYYTSFSSISLLATAKYIFQVGDAVVESVIKLKDVIFIIIYGILLGVSVICYKKTKKNKFTKKRSIKYFISAGVVFILFCFTLSSYDVQRLVNQWNRCYVVSKYGIYTYHINDLIKSIEPKFSSLGKYDQAVKEFNEYYKDNKNENEKNEYTDKYLGKNIIEIHAESIQTFLIGLKINGKEVTPNLNKLAKTGLYFNNFYSQVSVGTSSDTEFTLATSLMPSNVGTAFGNYYDKTFVSIPKLLKQQGYYTFAMHGNNASYWNRDVMHKNLGYDHFYAKEEFNINETVGLGLSDSSFFKQAVKKLKEIDKKYDNYYGTFITLSNHTPFSDLDKYGDFDVSKTIKGVKYPYLEGTKLGNYIKSAHYADKCLGEFFKLLKKNNLLDNTVIVLYGDHDARLPIEDYQKYYNYDPKTNGILNENDSKYISFDEYNYEVNRKVPLIIWDQNSIGKTIDSLMGMYDVMPTLGNMFGFKNKYALGRDIFNHLDENIVVFPTGNWITNKVYYNSQESEYLVLKESVIDDKYIKDNNIYANKLLSVSNKILVYDLIKATTIKNVDESKVLKSAHSTKK